MRGFVTDSSGQQWTLPMPTAVRLEYAAGVPCDSFWFCCPWEMGGETDPASWVRFSARYQEDAVFTGVVDECQVSLSEAGCRLEVSGRGMAALLLDNEALGEDYGVATQEDILRDHVEAYGIETVPGARLPAVSRFSVDTGSSEWSVLYEFARYYGGVAPRFDRRGRLVLTGWKDGQELLIDDGVPVTELVSREKRYGVLSQILVRDRYSGAVQAVTNHAFDRAGGQARRILTMPGRESYKTMRYTGQFQLDKSAAELKRVELTVAQPFCAWPGDLVRIRRDGWDKNGLFRAVQTRAELDERGWRTWLELAPPDIVI